MDADSVAWLARLPSTWLAPWQSAEALAAQAQARLDALVQHARAHSPFYARHYRGHAPPKGTPVDLAALPPVDKPSLMRDFDRWVTDPAVRYEDVRRFMADPANIGAYFLDRYATWKSSGTTGEPGVFLHTREALAVYDALAATRFDPRGRLAPQLAWRSWAGTGRAALIAATGEHFAGVSSWERLRRHNPWWARTARVFSVLQPVSAWVEALNAWQPAVLASYATVLVALAEEQRAGRLRIRPAACWSGGEWLAPESRDFIAAAFDCPVLNDYGASEAFSIAFECEHGWMHLNSDWVYLESVDAEGRPVPPGVPSHTALLTNLANRVQPLIRYDLGDSLTLRPDPCPCGNRLPALRVEGRRDDILHLRDARGRRATVCPMALCTVIEETAGVHRFQVVQEGEAALAVRIQEADPARRARAWRRLAPALRRFLQAQGLAETELRLDPQLPVRSPTSAKLCQVVAQVRG